MIVEFNQKTGDCCVKNRLTKPELEVLKEMLSDENKETVTIKFPDKYKDEAIRMAKRIIDFQVVNLELDEETSFILVNIFSCMFINENDVLFVFNKDKAARVIAKTAVDTSLKNFDNMTKKGGDLR